MPSIVSNFVMEDNATCLTVGMVPLAVGIMAGLISICLFRVGLALLGAGAGAGSGYIFWLLFSLFVPIGPWNVEVGPTTLMHIVCMLIGALLGAFLCMYCYQKSVLIVATSALGAFGVVAASAFLLAHADVRHTLHHARAPTARPPLPEVSLLSLSRRSPSIPARRRASSVLCAWVIR
jgi:hypothetical protein